MQIGEIGKGIAEKRKQAGVAGGAGKAPGTDAAGDFTLGERRGAAHGG